MWKNKKFGRCSASPDKGVPRAAHAGAPGRWWQVRLPNPPAGVPPTTTYQATSPGPQRSSTGPGGSPRNANVHRGVDCICTACEGCWLPVTTTGFQATRSTAAGDQAGVVALARPARRLRVMISRSSNFSGFTRTSPRLRGTS